MADTVHTVSCLEFSVDIIAMPTVCMLATLAATL